MYEMTGIPRFLTFLKNVYQSSQERQDAPNQVTLAYIHLLTP
jgi:hypothetical protein